MCMNVQYPFTPLVFSEVPRLNVAAPGFAFEIATSKWWNLPYLNFYLSSGSTAYDDPINMLGPEGRHYAYWSTTQWRGSMSFYFNRDSEPEFYSVEASRKRLNIVRLDLGAGTYNVTRVDYDREEKVAQSAGVIRSSRIQPYVAAEYSHASQWFVGDRELVHDIISRLMAGGAVRDLQRNALHPEAQQQLTSLVNQDYVEIMCVRRFDNEIQRLVLFSPYAPQVTDGIAPIADKVYMAENSTKRSNRGRTRSTVLQPDVSQRSSRSPLICICICSIHIS